MKGGWIKAYCMSGNDCSSLEWIAPIVFFVLTLIAIYFARNEYLTKIKNEEPFSPRNPFGFIPGNILMMVFYILVSICFFYFLALCICLI